MSWILDPGALAELERLPWTPPAAPRPNPLGGRCAKCGVVLERGEGQLRQRPNDPGSWVLVCAQHWTDLAPSGVAAQRLELATTAFPHQREGVRWLSGRYSALVGDLMGLGKTMQALLSLPPRARVLVVATGTLCGNWIREVAKWRPDLRARKHVSRMRWEWPEPGEVVATTYTSLPRADDTDAPPPGELVIVADEVQKAKNPDSGIAQRLTSQTHRALDLGGRVWLLSATPYENRSGELWNVLEIARLGIPAFGSYDGFVSCFGDGSSTPPAEQTPRIQRHVGRVRIRRTLDDAGIDLPPLRVEQRSVELTKADAKKVADLVRLFVATSEVMAEVKGTSLDPRGFGSAEAKRKARDWVEAQAKERAASLDDPTADAIERAIRAADEERDVSFTTLSTVRAALAQAMTGALTRIVEEYEEANEPLLVLSDHTAPIDLMGRRKGWGAIRSGVPDAERDRIVEAFERGELKGIACTIKTGGVGLTLTRAAHAVCVDRPWTWTALTQAYARLHRIGQTRRVLVTELVAAHPVAERVEEVVREKRRLEEVIEGVGAGGAA